MSSTTGTKDSRDSDPFGPESEVVLPHVQGHRERKGEGLHEHSPHRHARHAEPPTGTPGKLEQECSTGLRTCDRTERMR